jgi:hypothetical protein
VVPARLPLMKIGAGSCSVVLSQATRWPMFLMAG